MAALFVNVDPLSGYDALHVPPWQMVPVGGTKRIRLLGGTGLTVTSIPKGRVTVTELAGPFAGGAREFEVKGLMKGYAFLEAKDAKGTRQAGLQIGLKQKKTVKIGFNFVADNTGRQTVRKDGSVDSWVKVMNAIYLPQVNVELVKHSVRHVKVKANLGDVIRFSKHLPKVRARQHEWDKVVATGDGTADFNIFFVWEYEQDATPYTDDTQAGTLNGSCIFQDKGMKDIPENMAHETGHFLGCPDTYASARKDTLMYGYTDVRGRKIPRGDADVMNP